MSTADQLSELSELDAETWGERLARARARSRISLKEAAARISPFLPVSYSSLMRLEWLREPPADQRRRILAYLTLVAYGYEPSAFGLDITDLPRWATPELLGDLRIAKKPCFAVAAA